MPRLSYKKTKTNIDPIYETIEVAKLINYVMRDGKKSIARDLVYSVMESIKEKGEDPVKLLYKAIGNVAPTNEVKPRRVGGASYLVPIEVRQERKLYLALNWIVDAARARGNKEFRTFSAKLLAELNDAAANQGAAVNKRQQSEKLADANKAFAHFKW